MKKYIFALLLCAGFALPALGQSNPPLTVTEPDGSPRVTGVTTLRFSNGSVSCSGKVCTVTTGGGGGSPGGSSGQFQFNNAGAFGGTTGVTYAASGAPTVSITGQSTSQLTAFFLGTNTSSSPITAVQLGTGGSSGNFIEFRNSSGTALSVVDANGFGGFGITSSLGARLHAVAGGSGNAGRFDGAALSTNTVLVARQGSSSTGNLFEAQTSGGTAFFTVDNNTVVTQARSSIGTTSSDGIVLQNTTAAAAGAQQYSPRIRLTGQGWKTTATAASQTVDWAVETQPVQGSANPTANLAFLTQINGGGYTSRVNFGSADGAGIINYTATSSTSTPHITINGTTNLGIALSSAGGSVSFIGAGSENGRFNSNGLGVRSRIGFGSSVGSEDLFLTRTAAASLQFGATDAASPVAQTLSAQSVVGGTSNTAGATWTQRASLQTGNAVPGRFHVTGGAVSETSGTTQATAVDRLITGATKVLTNNSAITIVNVTNASNTSAGGTLDYLVEVSNGTEIQYEAGSINYGVTNKAGVFSGNTVTKFGNHQNATSGTLTVTFAISGANPALLSVNANSSLTPSTGYPRITYTLRNHSQQSVAIQ